MIEFLFQPDSVTYLALFVLTLAILGYLLSIKEKSKATWWMAALVTGFSLYWLHVFLLASLSPEILSVPFYYKIVTSIILLANGFAFFPFMMFAYYFMENPFPKEASIVKWVFGVLVTINICVLIYGIFSDYYSGSPGILNMVIATAVTAQGVAVLIRKYFQAKKKEYHQLKSAYRNYGLISIVMVLYLGSFVVQSYTPFQIPHFYLVVNTLLLLFTFGLTLIYINYSSELTSFQIKLIGLSLVTIIALFSVGPQVIFSEERLASFQPEIEPNQSIYFIADNSGGYETEIRMSGFTPVELGVNLNLADDEAVKVGLPFKFSFANQQWDSVHVSPNGIITFGDPIYLDYDPVFSNTFFYNALPKIAPLYYDFDPSVNGGVFLNSDSSKAIITWNNVPSHEIGNDSNTIQLVLHKKGNIEFNYGAINLDSVFDRVMRGLIPGEITGLKSQQSPSEVLQAGQYWFENLQIEYRRNLDPIFRSFIKFLLVFTAFVLVIFPFFYRNSLINAVFKSLMQQRLHGALRFVE